MKKIIAILLLICVFLTGCTSVTEYGQCIGVTDVKKPGLVYKPSLGNIIVGVIFIETIIVPIVVALDQFQCPVAKE